MHLSVFCPFVSLFRSRPYAYCHICVVYICMIVLNDPKWNTVNPLYNYRSLIFSEFSVFCLNAQWVSFLSFVDQSTFHGLHGSIFNSNHAIGALGRKIQARDKKGESQIQPLSQRHSTPSSAGCSVKLHFPGCQRSCFTLCAAHDLVSENLVK